MLEHLAGDSEASGDGAVDYATLARIAETLRTEYGRFVCPGITLTQHQREVIRAIHNGKRRAAKQRARVVTRAKAAKAAKGSKRHV